MTVSTIFRLNFETVQTVCVFFHFISIRYHQHLRKLFMCDLSAPGTMKQMKLSKNVSMIFLCHLYASGARQKGY
jgi:hypothetical protein